MYGHASMPSRIWSYGADAPTGDSATLVDEQIYAAHQYRNKLCEIELARRAAAEEVVRKADPGLQDMADRIAALESEIEQAVDAMRARNAKARKRLTDETAKQAKEHVRQLKGRLKEMRAEFKPRRLAVYSDPKIKADLDATSSASFSGIRKIRGQTDVYWGTYLTVEQACKSFGKGAPPRYLRFRGDGKIAVQLQRGLSVEDLLSGTDSRLRLVMTSGRNGTAYIRVGSEGRNPVWAACPVTIHRMPPANAMVKWAYLVRRREGTHYRWWFQLVLSRPEWPRHDAASSGRVAVDVGWRLVDAGLRVAYWVGDDGAEGQLIIPYNLLKRFSKPDSLRSIRDRNFDALRPVLCYWLRSHDIPDWMRERTITLGQWRSTARLAALAIYWRSNRFAWDGEMFNRVEAWRKQDKHLLDWEGHQRAKDIRWRADLYRKFAVMLMRRYGEVIVENINWRELSRKKQPDQDVNDVSIHHRKTASVGLLIETLVERMRVGKADPKHTTARCAECGKIDAFDAGEELVRTCRHCCHIEDQDRRAARNMLAAAARGEVVYKTLGAARKSEDDDSTEFAVLGVS